MQYEVENLFGAVFGHVDLQRRQPINPSDAYLIQRMKNACVESFAIHCRILVAFFFGHRERPHTTDIIAADFDSAWKTACPDISDDLVTARNNANKQVAHITEDREDLNQPGSGKTSEWNFLDIGNAISDLMNLFLPLVPKDRFELKARADILASIAEWNTLTTAHPKLTVRT